MNTAAANVRVGPDQVFRALSDRTRLRILCLLRRGELCVCDLVLALESPQPSVSRHLSYLRRAGLLRVRRSGLWCYYRLVEAPTPLQIMTFALLEAVAAELPEARSDVLRLDRLTSSRCD